MSFADLFCGIGSFHAALAKLGYKCALACDINPAVREAYAKAYGVEPHGDITKLPDGALEGIGVVTAGFPCQPFSHAGHQKGFADEGRGNMFDEICRLVRGCSSRPLLILENVCGLMSHDKGRTFAVIIEKLKDLGYENISYAALKCADFGIPQNRKRLFIVANPKPSPPIGDLVEKFKRESPSLSEFLGIPLERSIAFTLRCGGVGSPVDDRHCWDSYRTKDGGVHRLTIGDMMKLQGFPPDFFGSQDFTQARSRMAGNSIPTVMTDAVCRGALSRVGCFESSVRI
jgi:DNA (cytosine-5)-methyltransferase 1